MLRDDCDAAAAEVPETAAAQTTRDIPPACSLTADEREDRAPEVRALFASATASESLPDGCRLTFPGDDALAQRLFAFVLSERACCPFFSFTLRSAAPHNSIQLEVRGPASDPDIVKETFAPALALIQS